MTAEREGVYRSGIVVGTSGWNYPHWRGTWYPRELTQKNWFPYYCQRFHSVELNNPFYRMPAESNFQRWQEAAVPGFTYAVKANRYITHLKKLRDVADTLADFLHRASFLEDNLGPILFQLPPVLKLNTDLLKDFLFLLPSGFSYTFEFRNTTWFTAEVFDLLAAYNAAFCIYHLEGLLSPVVTTADFVYLRLHGPVGKYSGSYSDQELLQWSEQFLTWKRENRRIYCYFDNDDRGFAPADAERLLDILTEHLRSDGN